MTALPDQVYPTLVAENSSTATGQLLTDLTPSEWHALDTFENPIYQLASVQHDAGTAWAYAATEQLAAAPWTTTVFSDEHLPQYLERVANWRRRYDEAAG